MTRDIYEGVDPNGDVRRREHKPVCHCPFDPFRCAWERTTRTMTSAFAYVPVLSRVWVLLLAALALTGCGHNPAPQGPAQPTPAPIVIPPVVVNMVECWGCDALPPVLRPGCQAMYCPATPAAPTPEPRPRQEPTVASTQPATPSPTVPPAMTPTEAPTVAPHPSPTSAGPWMSAAPCEIGGVNGCDASNPKSVGADGECGFTAFCRCPLCIHNRNWPADQDHAHWTAPDEPGVFVDDQGNRHAPFGTCPTTGDPESIATCESDGGRAWDATCASVKAAGGFIKVLSGNVRLDPVPGKNCYAGYISGNGTYQVRMPAGARACKDPHDYLDDANWVNGCAHGEVLLTDHDVSLGGPVRVDR